MRRYYPETEHMFNDETDLEAVQARCLSREYRARQAL